MPMGMSTSLGIHRAVASMLVVCGLYLGASMGAYLLMPPLLHDPSCQLHHPHPPRSPTLCPLSTLPWDHINVKLRRTYPLVRSLPAEQVAAFSPSHWQGRDNGLTKWVTPTVNVLSLFSETIGQGIGLVNIMIFSSRRISAKDASTSQDKLINIFNRIEYSSIGLKYPLGPHRQRQ